MAITLPIRRCQRPANLSKLPSERRIRRRRSWRIVDPYVPPRSIGLCDWSVASSQSALQILDTGTPLRFLLFVFSLPVSNFSWAISFESWWQYFLLGVILWDRKGSDFVGWNWIIIVLEYRCRSRSRLGLGVDFVSRTRFFFILLHHQLNDFYL